MGNLPVRRLRAVAISGSLSVVFYEMGGFVKSNNVAVFWLTASGVETVGHFEWATDLAGLALAIEHGHVMNADF